MSKNRSYLRRVILVTLILFFGLQAFRVFLPKVSWYLGEALSAELKALFALGVFLTALLMPLIFKLIGERGLLGLTAGGLAMVYLGFQFSVTPLAYLVLASLGIMLWGWFVPFWLASSRDWGEREHVPVLVLGFALSFLFDTTLRTFCWSYDIAWRKDWISLFFSASTAALTLYLLWVELRGRWEKSNPKTPGWGGTLPFFGLGAFLFVAMSIVHNESAFGAASGMDDLRAYAMTSLYSILGMLGCIYAGASGSPRRWLLALINGLVLVASLVVLYLLLGQTFPLAWLVYAVTSITLWAGLGFLLTGISRRSNQREGLWRITLANFLALLSMLVILFMVMQYKLDLVTIIAGVLLCLTSVWAVAGEHSQPRSRLHLPRRIASIAVLITLLSVAAWCMLTKPVLAALDPAEDASLRIMTYNIHQGINADLLVDLDSIIDVIRDENPDVVALNEVNRGRATNGFLDVLPLISRRLGLPYVFGANYADGQYGNALLSRYSIVEWDNTHYTTNTTEVRGALRAVIETPSGTVTFYATHLDHLGNPDNAREAQVGELLGLWNGKTASVLLGDLNAKPDTAEIGLLYAADLTDVLAAASLEQVFTFWDPIPIPGRRIDYIFLTPDLGLVDAWVPQTRASDHLPVIAEVIP